MEILQTRHVDEAWRDRNDAMFRHLTEITERISDLPPGVNGRPNPMVHRLRRELDEGTQRIVEANQGLVRSYVKRFTTGASIDDARDFNDAGTLGLMQAIATYQVGKGTLASWAYKRIQCEVLEAVRAADHPTISAVDFARRPAILRAVRQLAATQESYIPSYAEIAAAADATVGQVRRVLEAPCLDSLAAPVGGDSDGTTLGDTIADEKADVDGTVLAKIDIESLERYGLACLDARELFVIARRFGLGTEPPQYLLAIGEILGLSRETVREIEVKALAKMQQGIKWMAVSPPGNTLGGNRRCASATRSESSSTNPSLSVGRG